MEYLLSVLSAFAVQPVFLAAEVEIQEYVSVLPGFILRHRKDYVLIASGEVEHYGRALTVPVADIGVDYGDDCHGGGG